MKEYGEVVEKNDDYRGLTSSMQFSNDFFYEMEQLSKDFSILKPKKTSSKAWFKYNEVCPYESAISVNLPPGKYRLVAATYDKGVNADFALSIGAKTGIISYLHHDKLSKTHSVRGSWSKSGGRDKDARGNKRYEFYLTEGEDVTINLNADNNVDTFLYLLNSNGDVVASDDDSGGAYQAKISKSLPPGRYTIVAATFDKDMYGGFSLRLDAPSVYELQEQSKEKEKERQLSFSTCAPYSKPINNRHRVQMTGNHAKEELCIQLKGVRENETIVFNTRNHDIAAVDKNNIELLENGTIQALIALKGSGETTITATGYFRENEESLSFKLEILKAFSSITFSSTEKINVIPVNEIHITLKPDYYRNIDIADRPYLGDTFINFLENTEVLYNGSHKLKEIDTNTISFRSNNSDVLSHYYSGVFRVKKPGTAEIEVKKNEDSFSRASSNTLTVKVLKANKPEVKTLSKWFLLDFSGSNIIEASDIIMDAYRSPDEFFSFNADREGVINDFGNGKIKLIGAGKVKVKVTRKGDEFSEGYTKDIELNVVKWPLPRVEFDYPDYDPNKHQLRHKFGDNNNKITIKIKEPKIYKRLNLVYKSTDEEIATVDNQGNVTIKSTGEVKINIHRQDPEGIFDDSLASTFEINIDKGKPTLNVANENRAYDPDYLITPEPTIDGSPVSEGISYQVKEDNDVVEVINESQLKILGAGTVVVKATLAENNNYEATTQEFTVTVYKAIRTLNVDKLSEEYSSGGLIKPKPTVDGSSVAEEIFYEVLSDNNVVKVDEDRSQLKILGAGIATVRASLEESKNYQKIDYDFPVTITRADSDIEVKDITQPYSPNKQISPEILNQVGDGDLSYKVLSGDNVVQVNGSQLKILGVGKAIVEAELEWTKNYRGKPYQFHVNIEKGKPTLNVANQNRAYAPDYLITPNPTIDGSPSSEGISYEVIEGSAVEVNGSRLKILRAGKATVRASLDESKNYQKIDYDFQVTITRADSDIEVKDITQPYSPNKQISPEILNQVGDGDLSYKVLSGDNVVQVNGSQLKILGAGTAVVKATLAENNNYKLTTDEFTVTVGKGHRTLHVANENSAYDPDYLITPNPTVDGSSVSEAISYQVKEGSAVEVNGSQLKILGVGTAVVKAILAENNNYELTTDEFTVTIGKGYRALNVEHISKNYLPDGLITPKPTIDGRPVSGEISYEVIEGSDVVQVNGGQLKMLGAGTAVVKAILAPIKNYHGDDYEFRITLLHGAEVQNLSFENSAGAKINVINKVCGESFMMQVAGHFYKDVSYYSEDETVARVDNDGRVTVLNQGVTNIIATSFSDFFNKKEQVSYQLRVEEKGPQAIQFKGEKNVILFGDPIPYTKEITDGWGNGAITFSGESIGATVNASTGSVTFDPDITSNIDIVEIDIHAVKQQDNCYLEAEDHYSIKWERNAIHSPGVDEVADKKYSIKWTIPDYKSDAKLELFYTNFIPDFNANEDEGTPIAEVSLGDGSYLWDTSKLPEGDYYIYGYISQASYAPPEYSDCDESLEDCMGEEMETSLEEFDSFQTERPLAIKHDYGLAMDCSDMYNYPAALGNAPSSCPSKSSMALTRDNGSILSFGKTGGSNELPNGDKYKNIAASRYAFAALAEDGSITTWGGATDTTPSEADFTSIYSGSYSFAAQRADGSIVAWNSEGKNKIEGNFKKVIPFGEAPQDLKKEHNPIKNSYRNNPHFQLIPDHLSLGGFIALRDDGSISLWSNFKRYPKLDNAYDWGAKFSFAWTVENRLDYFDGHWNHAAIEPVGETETRHVPGVSTEVTFWDLPVLLQFHPTDQTIIGDTLRRNYITIPFTCRVGSYPKSDSSRGYYVANDGCSLKFLESAANLFKLNHTYTMRVMLNATLDDESSGRMVTTFVLHPWVGRIWRDVAVKRDENGLARLLAEEENPPKTEYKWRSVGREGVKYIDIRKDASGTFIALTDKGAIEQWTFDLRPVDNVPEGGNFIKIFSSPSRPGYMAMRADGTIKAWGMTSTLSHFGNAHVWRLPDAGRYSWEDFGVKIHYEEFGRLGGWDFKNNKYPKPGYTLGAVVFSKNNLTQNDINSIFKKDEPEYRENDVIVINFYCKVLHYTPSGAPYMVKCDLSSVPFKAAKHLELDKYYHVNIYHSINDTILRKYSGDLVGARMDYRGLARIHDRVLDNQDSIHFESKIYAGDGFAAINNNREYSFWGDSNLKEGLLRGGGFDYGKINSSAYGFAQLSPNDGSIRYYSATLCLYDQTICHNPPSDDGYIKIYNNKNAFAGLKADGSITTWGLRRGDYKDGFRNAPKYRDGDCGATGGPEGVNNKDFISVLSGECFFTAIKSDGTMYTWGTIEGDDGSFPTNINN